MERDDQKDEIHPQPDTKDKEREGKNHKQKRNPCVMCIYGAKTLRRFPDKLPLFETICFLFLCFFFVFFFFFFFICLVEHQAASAMADEDFGDFGFLDEEVATSEPVSTGAAAGGGDDEDFGGEGFGFGFDEAADADPAPAPAPAPVKAASPEPPEGGVKHAIDAVFAKFAADNFAAESSPEYQRTVITAPLLRAVAAAPESAKAARAMHSIILKFMGDMPETDESKSAVALPTQSSKSGSIIKKLGRTLSKSFLKKKDLAAAAADAGVDAEDSAPQSAGPTKVKKNQRKKMEKKERERKRKNRRAKEQTQRSKKSGK